MSGRGKTDPTADLDRYIDEMKRKGSRLEDETLQRLIFSPGGSAVMEEERKEEWKKEEDTGYDDDFSDALEFIREDLNKPNVLKVEAPKKEEDEVYQDARSHFDASSVASYSVYSPSVIGSLDPLSPNTSYATEKMSRVSLRSPAIPPTTIAPIYYPSNGQGVAVPSHPSPLPPSSIHHQSIPHPINYPVPSIPHHPHLPPVYHQPLLPPSNGLPVPYPPQMAPSPYIPQSMPLPPTVPSRNGQGMSSSVVNPLFSPYPPSNHYHMHPQVVSPYPPMQYPANLPKIHNQRAAEIQRSKAVEMSRFLAHQQQLTARMLAQHPNQMQPQLHTPPQKTQQRQNKSYRRPQRQCPPPPQYPPPSSLLPPQPQNRGFSNTQLAALLYRQHIVRVMNEALGKKWEGDVFEGKRILSKAVMRMKKRTLPLIKKEIPEAKEEEKKEKEEEKEGKESEKKVKDEPESDPKKEEWRQKLLKRFGKVYKDDDGELHPPERIEGGMWTFKGDPRFPFPKGKNMSFYLTPLPDPPPYRMPCPAPAQRPLKYIEQIPVCKEGREKILLCRGHSNTKEREQNPTLFGTKYLQKIQYLFHSVNGDPARVPNASTEGIKWENPLRDTEIPIGMEIYREVRGRIWNADYDYTPIFKQLIANGERSWGFKCESPSVRRKRSTSETRKEKMKERLAKIENVREEGCVFNTYAVDGDSGTESDVSDCGGDGRIGVGREGLRKAEEKRNERKENIDIDYVKKEEESREKALVRDMTKKIHNGYYPLLNANRYWAKITYFEKSFNVGVPYMALWHYKKVFVDPHSKKKASQPDRFFLSSFDRLDRDQKTTTVLMQSDMTFHFRYEPGGYIILCSESEPTLFVQSPLYNAMMGEELDTIVRITKGHEMIIFDENFFNLLLQQAYQYGDQVLYEMKQLLLTRVSSTKGWGEAYVKSSILEALVWVEFAVLNAMNKIDTLIRADTSVPLRRFKRE